MLASVLPARFGGSTPTESSRPGWLSRQVTPFLQSLSSRACTHPIHTIVFVALLASTTYVGLLEGSLFEKSEDQTFTGRRTEWGAMIEGSKTLLLGEETGWKWQTDDSLLYEKDVDASRHLALLTFVFPNSYNSGLQHNIPATEVTANTSAELLPSTLNPLSSISQDSALAFSIPYVDAPDFLSSVQELPTSASQTSSPVAEDEDDLQGYGEEKRWIMKAARGDVAGSRRSFQRWATNAWTTFVDLLKNAETLDIIIMVLGYTSMHLTFVSLFLSMQRMGSNFWLATTVLFSSVFAFLFGLIVTTKLGVPVNMILLSEGLPFLVVTIGFEKPILLTKAVLDAALSSRRQVRSPSLNGDSGRRSDSSPFTIQYAVQVAVKEKGFEIVRDYCIEIIILIAGASSGVQGGLRQFCFLAAWILFFDCILLFTFYTAILSVKLEINRIKRHVALRKALEEDGVSRRVAENVASSNEWPKLPPSSRGSALKTESAALFGKKVKDSSVPKFKVLMVGGFVIINILNLCTIPFRGGNKNVDPPSVSGLSSVTAPPPMDPFKVAGNGLDIIFASSKTQGVTTIVTVLAPIKYELEYPSVHYASYRSKQRNDQSSLDVDYTEQLFDSVGGKVVESLLKSLEDPVLSKWIIVALAMSVMLNGYLFNAARWSIKEPHSPDPYTLEEPVSNKEQPYLEKPDPKQPEKPKSIEGDNDDGLAMKPLKKVESANGAIKEAVSNNIMAKTRSRAECEQLHKDKRTAELNDKELVDLSLRGKIPGYALERTLGDTTRAVKIRRAVISKTPATSATANLLEQSLLPYHHYDFSRVLGACCENVIGYMPLPVGVAGPLVIDGQDYFIPMATTEGVLVASTSRGCKAINAGGGAMTVLTGDGMTRGPCVSFDTLVRAGAAKQWLDSEAGQKVMKKAFDSTSRFARLQTIKTAMAGTYLYIRFKTTTGDAMGMNMISKGVEHALHVMANESGFEDMAIVSVSGNYCTDKKPAAINWIDGRGKSVVAEAIIPGDVVRNVLKSDVNALVELNVSKNLIGSAMAGSIGGFNAHAANVLTAIFLATGQDPAQNVESSNCITIMKNYNGNLQISVSMPSIEVGTIGGGTILEPQGAMLDLLGVRGAHPSHPGQNAQRLARIVAAAVLAGELSLCSALAAGHLVKSHMAHNRSAPATRSSTPVQNISAGSSSGHLSGIATPVTLAMTSVNGGKAAAAGEYLKPAGR